MRSIPVEPDLPHCCIKPLETSRIEIRKVSAGPLLCAIHADDFHPPENIAKMTNGIPLNDADRSPWLASLHILISSSLIQNRPGVLACSALKESYRQQMLDGNDDAQIVHLTGNYDLIWPLLSRRTEPGSTSGRHPRPHWL